MKTIIAAIVIIALVIFAPFLSIWAVNTLFPAANIGYTLETWAAAIILSGVLKSNVKVSK